MAKTGARAVRLRSVAERRRQRGRRQLFALLADRTPATEEEGLPSTGFPPEWERTLSSPFVLHSSYGTRCSTLVAIEPSGACYLAERRFDATGACSGETQYRLRPGEWPSRDGAE